MKDKANTPKTLQDAIRYFSDEQVCIDTVAQLRWPNGPECPACGGKEHYYLATQKRWKCKECWKQFTVKLGTIFEDSPIKLDKWLCALWMIVNCRNGVSSYEVARTIGITQKSAWFVLHRLRYALATGSIEKLGGGGNTVEVDETFVGGKLDKMHKSRRLKLRAIESNIHKSDRNGVPIGRTAVMGFLDRDVRKVRAQVIPSMKRESLQNAILENIQHGTRLYTDNMASYEVAADKFIRETVDHVSQYVRGNVHTNGIENFWSLLKRSLKGTYVAVEPFHLDRYVAEQVFRFNNRKDADGKTIPDAERFAMALSQIGGKRLTFAEVTGKAATTPS